MDSAVLTPARIRSGLSNSPSTSRVPHSLPEYPCRCAEPLTGPENANLPVAGSKWTVSMWMARLVMPAPLTATSDVIVSESGAVWRVYTRPTVTRIETSPAVQVVEYAGSRVQAPSNGPPCAVGLAGRAAVSGAQTNAMRDSLRTGPSVRWDDSALPDLTGTTAPPSTFSHRSPARTRFDRAAGSPVPARTRSRPAPPEIRPSAAATGCHRP